MSAMVSVNSSWRKSSRCVEQGACVEVSVFPQGIGLRDSKRPDEPFLLLSVDSWRSFIESIKRGDLDA